MQPIMILFILLTLNAKVCKLDPIAELTQYPEHSFRLKLKDKVQLPDESGNNELEVLEFRIDDHCYGINVAKIKEIIVYQEVTPVPNAHPSIEGIFMPRETMITAIDLKNCLQKGDSEPNGLFIITNFNKCFEHSQTFVVNNIKT